MFACILQYATTKACCIKTVCEVVAVLDSQTVFIQQALVVASYILLLLESHLFSVHYTT